MGGGGIPSSGQSFVPYICYSHYMKEDMARNTDLNQFVGTGKHLEETLLEKLVKT